MKGLGKLSIVLVVVLLVSLFLGVSCKSEARVAEETQKPQEVKVIIEIRQDGSVATESVSATATEETVISTETTKTDETKAETATTSEGTLPAFYESEGGVPGEGISLSVDVTWEESEEISGGYAKILDKLLPGGSGPDRGFYLVLLAPEKETYTYTIYNPYSDKPELKENWPAQIWHGARLFGRTPTEKDWKLIVNDGLSRMYSSPNGSLGMGCDIVDVLVIKGDKILFEKTFNKGELLNI